LEDKSVVVTADDTVSPEEMLGKLEKVNRFLFSMEKTSQENSQTMMLHQIACIII